LFYSSQCFGGFDKEFLERRLAGTHEVVDLLAALEDHEGGHGRDPDLLGSLGDHVDVELVVPDALELLLLGELLQDRGDDPARAAPGGVEVDDDGPVLVDDPLEFLKGRDLGDGHFGL